MVGAALVALAQRASLVVGSIGPVADSLGLL
jgi:hypothetical protein